MKIKTKLVGALGVAILFIITAIAMEITAVSKNDKQVETSRTRYLSFALADEFRHTSMDLTRLARTFVATGEQKYWDEYFNIVNWRNGKTPRPDYVNNELYPNQKKVQKDIMKELNFSKQEFALLAKAGDASNDLINTETQAMEIIRQGVFVEGPFQPLEDESLKEFSLRILFDSNYHQEVVKIMTPVNKFFAALDKRTAMEVEQASNEASFWLNAAFVIQIVVAIIVAGITWFIIGILVGPVTRLSEIVLEVEKTGDFSMRSSLVSHDEVGQTVKAFNNLMTMLQRALQEINSIMNAMKNGIMTQQIEAELVGDMDLLKTHVNASVTSLREALHETNEVMSAVAEGNLSRRVTAELSGDLDLLKGRINNSVEGLQIAFNEINSVMHGVETGDLTIRVETALNGDLDLLKGRINASIESLAQAFTDISFNIQQVATAASQTSDAVGQVADGSQQQVNAISQVSSAINESNQSIDDISLNVQTASQYSKDVTSLVEVGQQKMQHMVEVVNNISQNSEKISKITDVIDKIANQTNLLSLNAAIEAARAGEHGKGFAVVADEVRKLAENVSSSTEEITLLVNEAAQQGESGVSTAAQVREEMSEISRVAKQSDEMMSRIASSIEQQSSSMAEINSTVKNLHQIGQSNASASEEITATIIDLSRIAEDTRNKVDQFKV